MGRGGYNGGSASVDAPKSGNPYIFAEDRELDANLLRRSRIVEAGDGLHNEHGAVQSEFGYILSVEPTVNSKQPARASFVRRTLSIFRKTDRASSEVKPNIKWVSASHLYHTAPEGLGLDLANKYHLENPEAPTPWGDQYWRYEYN